MAALLLLAVVFVADDPGGGLSLRTIDEISPLAFLVFSLSCGVLVFRRSRPLIVLAVAIAGAAMSLAAGFGDLSGVAVIALYSVGRYVERDEYSYAGVGAVVAYFVLAGVLDEQSASDLGVAVVAALVSWYLGRSIRANRLREVERALEREAQAHQAVAEERARIARELHDIVAHRVSLMTVQAGAAKTVVSVEPDAARDAMEEVENVGRQALGELRHLLDVLRPEAETNGSGPQKGLSDLPSLIDEMESAGLDITLTTEGARVELPAQVDLSAYRIVQESLTNALRHAGTGTRVAVSIGYAYDSLDVEITNEGRGSAATSAGGHGIVGMRERARLLGGEFAAGPRSDGGFRVAATLPLGGDL